MLNKTGLSPGTILSARPHWRTAAEHPLPVFATGVSYMPDIGFIVLVIAAFALIGLIAKGVSRL
ncbi:hypothetical protein ABT173_43240 [Streptomyces sp. NPDC001795]|uniref:hypothetical protein n=1 Tax=unclassified Streptomyces TaxID=2593676 RepID=UPI00332621BE